MPRKLLDAIFLVADYGDDLAFAEVIAALQVHFPGVAVVKVRVPKFRTEVAGFVAAQLARQRLPADRAAIFVNVDPRLHRHEPIPDGAGAPFVCARLAGVAPAIFAPAAGYVFSFLKPRIAQAVTLMGGEGAGQFRSRDDYPAQMASALRTRRNGHTSVDPATIPDFKPPRPVVLWVDRYGNVKTSITRSAAQTLGWKPGTPLAIRVGGVGEDYPRSVAWCATSIMGVTPGTFVFAPGSSGDPDDPYMEFAVRAADPRSDDSGTKRLGNPVPGEELKVTFPPVMHRAPRRRAPTGPQPRRDG